MCGTAFGLVPEKDNNMTFKHFRKGLALLVSILTLTTYAQDSKKEREKAREDKVQSIINSKDFVFIAQTVVPTGGRTIYLNTAYSLRVSNDTLVADLPYFGRAYSAPINTTGGGIKLTSTEFDLKVQPRKKGGWDILITPKDARDVRQLFLTASKSGSASLQVTSNNRQAISFSGFIKETKS